MISFRLESKLAARLNKKAIAERLSLNQYVKELFINALVQQDLRDDLMDVHSEVQDVGTEVEGLRRDIALLLSKVLVELADWDEEQAKDWIGFNFSEAAEELFEDEES